MAINKFEGARRISKIVAAIWIISWCVAAFDDGYEIYDNCIRAIPVKTVIEEKSQPREIDIKVACGKVKPSRETDLYIDDSGNLIDPCMETEISKQMASNYRIPYDPSWKYNPVVERSSICENRSIDSKGWPQLLKDLGQNVLGIISGLLFLWAFTWAIGWIVRGFMGIPRGQDKKE